MQKTPDTAACPACEACFWRACATTTLCPACEAKMDDSVLPESVMLLLERHLSAHDKGTGEHISAWIISQSSGYAMHIVRRFYQQRGA